MHWPEVAYMNFSLGEATSGPNRTSTACRAQRLSASAGRNAQEAARELSPSWRTELTPPSLQRATAILSNARRTDTDRRMEANENACWWSCSWRLLSGPLLGTGWSTLFGWFVGGRVLLRLPCDWIPAYVISRKGRSKPAKVKPAPLTRSWTLGIWNRQRIYSEDGKYPEVD